MRPISSSNAIIVNGFSDLREKTDFNFSGIVVI